MPHNMLPQKHTFRSRSNCICVDVYTHIQLYHLFVIKGKVTKNEKKTWPHNNLKRILYSIDGVVYWCTWQWVLTAVSWIMPPTNPYANPHHSTSLFYIAMRTHTTARKENNNHSILNLATFSHSRWWINLMRCETVCSLKMFKFFFFFWLTNIHACYVEMGRNTLHVGFYGIAAAKKWTRLFTHRNANVMMWRYLNIISINCMLAMAFWVVLTVIVCINPTLKLMKKLIADFY